MKRLPVFAVSVSKRPFLLLAFFLLPGCSSTGKSSAGLHTAETKALPKAGRLVDGQPTGRGWVNLIADTGAWNAAKPYWTFTNGMMQGDYYGGQYHNYAYTKTQYANFELQALVRMSGKEANSGVCIRIQPTDADNVPGYQVDMGPGYWGCLWEERRAGMVQQYSRDLADKLVNEGGWNHYYIIANGHHIEAWLNGVKTIDTVHLAGFSEGAIGLQLCHGDKHTVVDVKTLSVREIKYERR